MSDYLQKIVYLTDSQYETLAGGGTVGSLTGLNDNYIYITDGKVSLSDFDDSFILPVNKGGTGASSWASGKILVGNGSSTFSTIDKATAATGGTLVERNANGDFSARNITMTQGNIGSMTLSGTTIAALTAINTSGGNGLLAYKPSSWTGVTSSQWGVGTIDVQGVIRSSNSDLLHSRNGTNSVIFDAGNYKTYAYALDGSNTGTKLCLATQSTAYTYGIQFMNSTTKKASIGCDTNGNLCFYGANKVVLRPILNAATDGVEITTSSMIPTKNQTVALGGSSNQWSNVYSQTFTHTHEENASDGIKVLYSTTIDFFIGVGTANSNHGLYDKKASDGAKWILSADATNHVWTFVGNVTGNCSGSSGSCTGNAASATKVAAKLATTTKTYLLGTSTAITATAANVEMIGDTGVYLTTTAGQLNATTYLVNEKVRLEYNSTDQSLDFIFV